jgi:SAM-dependent methyltransferase
MTGAIPWLPGHNRAMNEPTRWERPESAELRRDYAARQRRQHAEGTDVAGEARFIDALLDRGATVLDAGSGMGRLAAELNLRGHYCIGVDRDRSMLEAARELHGPGHTFLQADLAELVPDSLTAGGYPGSYDLIAAVGNVMVYLAEGTEARVLRNFAALLKPDGRLVTGFATDREYTLQKFDDDAASAGFEVQHRFSTWQLDTYRPRAGWATSILVKYH